jgi:DNA-binding CsgD family transcriptional regulator
VPRLSRAQEEARQRIAAIVGGGLTPEGLASRVLATLQGAIPSAGQRFLGIDPATLLVNRTLAASADDGPARREWLELAYLASGPLTYIDFPNLMRANLTAVALHDRQEECWGYAPAHFGAVSARQHRDTFHATGVPAGGVLLVSLPADGRWVGAIQMYRRDRGKPYSRGDVAFLRLVAPAIGQGLRAALDRERALAGEAAAPGGSGIVVLGPDRRVRFSTPAGDTWSALIRDAARDDAKGLPTAILAAAARLRAGADGPASGKLLAPTAAGPVRVEASPAGEDGAVAIVLAREEPPAPPAIPDGWPLTPAERQVAALLLRGLGNAQIADRLCLSENTIQTHLRHIYDKLGVRNRSQALARFFQETYWPGLRGEEVAP